MPAILCLCAILCTGCQQEMAVQPSYRPLEASSFFADGRASRDLPEGTVARGHLRTDPAYFTGRVAFRDAPARPQQAVTPGDGSDSAEAADTARRLFAQPDFIDEFPLPIDEEFITHGGHRYMIYCVPCHDSLGTGHGKIVERGYTRPPSYHIDRLRDAPVGQLFAVANEGYGSMPSYGGEIPTRDLWAIVAYIRALQLSQHYPENDLSAVMLRELDAVRTEAAP